MGILDELLPREQTEKKPRAQGAPAPQRGLYESQRKIRLDDLKGKYPEVARIDGTLVLLKRGGPWMVMTFEVEGEPVDVWLIERSTAEVLGWLKEASP